MKKELIIFFLIDALGWEWIKDQPFMDDCATVKKPAKTIFGFSSAAIPSILTGKYPDEHGRWNLLYYSPKTSPFRWTRPLRILPRPLLENRVTRKLINIISKRLVKADGYFSGYVATDKLCLFDICEKYNIYRPGGIAGSETIVDYLAGSGIPHRVYSYHDYTDAGAFAEMEKDIRVGAAAVYFAYLPELDAFLHTNSDKPAAVAEKLRWYEDHIRQTLEVAKAQGSGVRWFIFSDHGMAPITAHYDLIGDLRREKIDLDGDCLAVFDSTMARFWTDSPDIRQRILKVLERCPAGRIVDEAELEALRVGFDDDRYGQIIFLMKPGTLIFPNLFGSHRPTGMHGFHPDDRNSYGVYLSNVSDHNPREIVDFYGVMRSEIDRIATPERQ